MENAKDIRDRISSIRDTKKITNAMYLIASVKMRKAKADLDKTRPYFAVLQSEIKRLFRIAGDVESPYFYPINAKEKTVGSHGILIVTADKGLAGVYNQNVLKYSLKMLGDYPDSKLFVVGEYGRQFFQQQHIPVEEDFQYTAQNPTLRRARDICAKLLSLYDAKRLDKIYIVYTDLKGGQTEEVKMTAASALSPQRFRVRRSRRRQIRIRALRRGSARSHHAQLCFRFRVQRARGQLLQRTERADGGDARRKRECGRDPFRPFAGIQPRSPERHHAGDHGSILRARAR